MQYAETRRKAAGTIARVFFPFAAGFFLSYVFRTIHAVIAPDLIHDLSINAANLGFLTSVYFLAFLLTQIPLGFALDRWGSRRVGAVFLAVAAAGAFVFSAARTLRWLAIGRMLIGVGVSAALMAPFAAYTHWVRPERLSRINGFQMAAGGLGAVTATVPLHIALQFFSWRGLFRILGVTTLGVAILILTVVPRREGSEGATLSTGEQFKQLRKIFIAPIFVRLAIWAAVSQAAFLSIHGLWAGPWLLDVGGYNREEAATILMLMAFAIMFGFFSIGYISDWLAVRGVPPATVLITGLVIMKVLLFILAMNPGPMAPAIWILFSFIGTSGALAYSVFSRAIGMHGAGKINTAYNLMVFLFAFPMQWGIGAIVSEAEGWGVAASYRLAFLTIIGVLVVGMILYILLTQWSNRRGVPCADGNKTSQTGAIT